VAKERRVDIERLLEQAALEDMIECPECGRVMEPDCEECVCGWKNVLRKLGFI